MAGTLTTEAPKRRKTTRELIIDSFAGGGGASTGIEAAWTVAARSTMDTWLPPWLRSHARCAALTIGASRIGSARHAAGNVRMFSGREHRQQLSRARSLWSASSAVSASSSRLFTQLGNSARRNAPTPITAGRAPTGGGAERAASNTSSTRQRVGGEPACAYGGATVPHAAVANSSTNTAASTLLSITSEAGSASRPCVSKCQISLFSAKSAMRSSTRVRTCAANSFGAKRSSISYILTGTKTSQVARIGNSVCPPVVEALVRANFGEVA